MAGKDVSLVIGGEDYSLTTPPRGESKLVLEEKKRLLGEVNLEALVDDLSRAGKFVSVAYNGVAGNTELQVTVQSIGYDITKLCDKAAITVVKFTRASHSMVLDLQSTYEYLLDGLEEMALDTLIGCSKIAGDMAADATKLAEAFKREEEEIEALLEKTMNERSEEEKLKRDNEMHKIQQKQAKETSEKAREAEEKAKKAYRDAQKEEIERTGDATFLGILSIAVLPVAPATIAGAVMSGKKAREARKEKIRQEEAMKEHAAQRKKALADFAEFAKKIQHYDARAAMGIGGDAVIEALHKAIGALKSLTVIMLRAADFWEKMKLHCQSIADNKMDEKLKKALEVGGKKGIVVWEKDAFKRNALYFFAQWVALEAVCNTYAKKLKPIQEQLYATIQQNPTYEESRRNIKFIAADLVKEIEEANKKLDDEQARKDKSIKELQAANAAEESSV